MSKYLLLLSVLFVLSCGNYTKKIRQSHLKEVEDKSLIDKSRKVEIREIDTLITIPADSLQLTVHIRAEDTEGDSLVRNSITKNGIDLITIFNRHSKTFTATAHFKEQLLPVKATQIIVQENDIAIKQNRAYTQSQMNKEISSPALLKWYVVVPLLLLAICLIVYKFSKFIK